MKSHNNNHNHHHQQNTNQNDNIKVLVRVRPFQEREKNVQKCVQACDREQTIDLRGKTANAQGSFKFDYVRCEGALQREIFETIGKDVVEKFLEGFHGCVIAYGQTGAGKTFTMQGSNDYSHSNNDNNNNNEAANDDDDDINDGLIPRALRRIFQECERGRENGVEHEVECAYLEIYNEQLTDLFNERGCSGGDDMMMNDNDTNNNSNNNNDCFLQIREDPKNGTFVENLTKVQVNTAKETYDAFLRGSLRRRVGETEMNRNSSRSHSVFSITLKSTELHAEKKRTLHLVDLAGSERQKATEAAGARLKEASAINKSLSALGNVIKSLVDVANGRDRHVPFRDSKLTWLLKDALSGNAKCAVIACISPALINADETASTLKFASRAKLVKVRAQLNERKYNNNMSNTPFRNNNINSNNNSALESEVTRLRAMIDEIVSAPTASTSLSFLTAAVGGDDSTSLGGAGNFVDEENGDNDMKNNENRIAQQKSSKITEFVLNGMKRASALEKTIMETNRANLVWQRDAFAKQAQLEAKVGELSELVERLDQNVSSTQMVLKLREASLKKHGIDKDDVDKELVELRKIVSVPPEVVKLRMELASVNERAERAEAEATSRNVRGEFSQMVEELNRMRALYAEQSELAANALEQKLSFETQKIQLMEDLKTLEIKLEISELRAVDAEANQFRAENAKNEAERLMIESKKITQDALDEKVRVEATFAENKQVMEEMFQRLEDETQKRDEMESENVSLREAHETFMRDSNATMKETNALLEKVREVEKAEASTRTALEQRNEVVKEIENKLKTSEIIISNQADEIKNEKSKIQKSVDDAIANMRDEKSIEIEQIKKTSEHEKQKLSDDLNKMKIDMEKLREEVNDRVEAARSVAEEKLEDEMKYLREERTKVAEERLNLEASFTMKRVELEKTFEEKERAITSTCDSKVAAAKAAAGSEFKAAATLQLKVKELTRKLIELQQNQQVVATITEENNNTKQTTTPTHTPLKQQPSSLLLKSGVARRVPFQPLVQNEQEEEESLSVTGTVSVGEDYAHNHQSKKHRISSPRAESDHNNQEQQHY